MHVVRYRLLRSYVLTIRSLHVQLSLYMAIGMVRWKAMVFALKLLLHVIFAISSQNCKRSVKRFIYSCVHTVSAGLYWVKVPADSLSSMGLVFSTWNFFYLQTLFETVLNLKGADAPLVLPKVSTRIDQLKVLTFNGLLVSKLRYDIKTLLAVFACTEDWKQICGLYILRVARKHARLACTSVCLWEVLFLCGL